MQRAVCWGVLTVVVALSGSASAAGVDRDTREAKERFVEGLARARAGDWEGARRSFQQSIAVRPTQTAAFNLALANEKCDHALEALETFKDYLHTYSLSDDELTQARRHVADLMSKTGHIEVEAPSGTLITIDAARSAGASPLAEPIDVEPGRHVVDARFARGSQSLAVDAPAGQVVRVSIAPRTEETTPAATAVMPSSTDTAAAGASDTAPVSSPDAPPASRPGASAGRVVTVAVLGGAAIAAGSLGLVFGQQSNSDAGKIAKLNADNRNCGVMMSAGCEQLVDTIASAHSEHVASEWLFGAGAALAVAGITAWLLWPATTGGATTTSVRFAPAVGTRGAGASVAGAFE